jgi:Secretion system C-terminal sorting domain
VGDIRRDASDNIVADNKGGFRVESPTLPVEKCIWIFTTRKSVLSAYRFIHALELEKSTPATEVQSGKMSITPNPSEGAIRLQFDAAVSGRGRVVITDTTGKSLVDKLYSAENQDIDLGFLPPGVYYVVFHPENAAGKILVEKWIKK